MLTYSLARMCQLPSDVIQAHAPMTSTDVIASSRGEAASLFVGGEWRQSIFGFELSLAVFEFLISLRKLVSEFTLKDSGSAR